MRILTYVAATIVLATAGCAAKPQSIAPTRVSSVQFAEFSCAELTYELNLAIEQRAAFARRQSGNRTRDTLLNVLVLPGLGAATGDHETEVAESKGRVIAIESALATRCGG